MAVDQFCLKWNNFQTSIITAFESLQNTEDLADVTLTCEGISVKAHKIILSACSPYFRTVFKENPCPHPIVILKDVFYIDLLAVLNFMYHGEVLVSKDQLKSFLQTAEILQVSGLNGYNDFNSAKHAKNPPKVQQKTAGRTDAENAPPKKLKTAHLKNKPQQKPAEFSKKDTPPPPDDFETVQVGRIKTEVAETGDDDYLADYNRNTDVQDVGCEKTKQQGSILEAALDGKEQGTSILERSLTSSSTSVKSPSAPPFAMEHLPPIQLSPDIPKTIFIPRKSPEEFERTIVLKQKLPDLSTLEIPADLLQPNVKLETEPSKTIELNMDSTSGDGCVQLGRNQQDMQPHHSSQCGNCPHCGKIYSNQSALKYHVRLVHSDLTNMYCCHLCPESFDYREGYKKHMVEVHSIRN